MIQTDLHKLASRFIGLAEVSGGEDNPMILAMLKKVAAWAQHDEVPWCSAFVNFVAWFAGCAHSGSARARSWLDVGDPVPLTAAVRGMDVVVLARGDNPEQGHVGFFDHLDGLGVYILGGNQGDRVSVERFPVSRVLGVRRLAPVS